MRMREGKHTYLRRDDRDATGEAGVEGAAVLRTRRDALSSGLNEQGREGRMR